MKTILSINILNYNNYINLKKTLKSLASLRHLEIELLIFDDNSKDKSIQIAKEFKKKDSRIKIYKVKKNLGVGNLRNLALTECKGQYLMFVDSGDQVYSKNIDATITLLKKKKFELLVGNFRSEKPDHGCFKFKGKKIREKSLINQLLRENKIEFRTVCWRFIVSKKFLLNNSIKFTENNRKMEDIEFVLGILTKSKKILNLNQYLINQRYDQNSLTEKNGTKITTIDLLDAWRTTRNVLKESYHLEDFKIKFVLQILRKNLLNYLPLIIFLNKKQLKKFNTFKLNIYNFKNKDISIYNEFINLFYNPSNELFNLKKKYLSYLNKMDIRSKKIVLYCYSFWAYIFSKYLMKKNIKPKVLLDSNKLLNNRYDQSLSLRVLIPNNFIKKNQHIKLYSFFVLNKSITTFYTIKKKLIKLQVNKKDIYYLNFGSYV